MIIHVIKSFHTTTKSLKFNFKKLENFNVHKLYMVRKIFFHAMLKDHGMKIMEKIYRIKKKILLQNLIF